jgi:hypothetical protein
MRDKPQVLVRNTGNYKRKVFCLFFLVGNKKSIIFVADSVILNIIILSYSITYLERSHINDNKNRHKWIR